MLSIIIPVYNEAHIVKKALGQIHNRIANKSNCELIVVNGQSTDGTARILKRIPYIKTIESPQGRAVQMNAGAKAAGYKHLFFLHLDSQPPNGFDQRILNALNHAQAGCFRLKFDDSHWWLRLIAWFTRFNFTVCRGGDQGLFITQKVFKQLSGFDENYVVFEDHDIVSRFYKRGYKFKVIQTPIVTSARLFKEMGIFNLQGIYNRLYIERYLLNHNPEQLYKSYKKRITKEWISSKQ
jgi:rSAM/selenodomain-associated transferase 2